MPSKSASRKLGMPDALFIRALSAYCKLYFSLIRPRPTYGLVFLSPRQPSGNPPFNVIETHELQRRVQRVVSVTAWKQKAAMRGSTTAHCFGRLTGLAAILDGLRCRFVQFKLCAHFLNLRGLLFNGC